MSESPKTITTLAEMAHELVGASITSIADAIRDTAIPLTEHDREALIKSMPVMMAKDFLDRIYEQHGTKGVMMVISRFGESHPSFAMALGVGSLAKLVGGLMGMPEVPPNPDKGRMN